MTLEIQRIIATNFANFATLFSPSFNGGLLNYFFQPVTSPDTGKTLLSVTQVTGVSFLSYINNLLLKSAENYPVVSVLPQNVQPTHIQSTFYPVQLALSIIAFIVTLCMLVAIIVVPCRYYRVYRYRHNQRKPKTHCTSKTTIIEELDTEKNQYETPFPKDPSQRSSSIFEEHIGISVRQSRWYLGLGVSIGILMLFLVLCTPFVYISLDAAVVALNGNSNTSGASVGLESTLEEAFVQTISFLQNLPSRGSTVTNSLLDTVQTDLVDNLHILVGNILEQLLQSYGARSLIDQVDVLSTDVVILQNVTTFVAQSQQGTIADLSYFQGTMQGYKTSLRNSLEKLCPKLTVPAEVLQCATLKNELAMWYTSFDSNNILVDPSITLSQVTAIFGLNLTQLLGEFDKLAAQLEQTGNELVTQIQGSFNLTEQFQALTALWDQIDANVSKPAIESVNQIRPVVLNIVRSIATIFSGLGYVFLVVFTLVLLILITYGILLVTEAHERDLLIIRKTTQEDHCYESTMPAYASIPHTFPPSTHPIKCGFILPALLCSMIPLLVLVGGAIVLLSSAGNNEACRYSSDSFGVRMTDEALNLYIQYIWPDLISNQTIDPSVLPLLDIPLPQNVLDGVLVKCKQTAPSSEPGFLPSVGMNQLVNVTAVIEDPSLQASISEAENKLVTEILQFNFESFIPQNLDSLFDTITNITSYLDNSDYTGSIAELNKSVVDRPWISNYTDRLLLLVTPYVDQHAEALTIRTTVEAVQDELQNSEVMNNRILRLIDAFVVLQAYKNFTRQLQQLQVSLTELVKVLKNPAALEAPIRPTYRENVAKALDNLTLLLDRATMNFTADVITCGTVNTIAVSVLRATCGDDGLINRLGGFGFIWLLMICSLLLIVLLFQFFLCLHEHHCLYATNQGIPLHLFVKFVYRHLANEHK